MKLVTTTIAAALLGLSLNAFADSMNPQTEAKPFAQSAGNYSFGDISSVTHN
jgi:hypothetical protein